MREQMRPRESEACYNYYVRSLNELYEPLDGSRLSGVPILLVNDNSSNRRILKDSVRRWGMKPTVVTGANVVEIVNIQDGPTRHIRGYNSSS